MAFKGKVYGRQKTPDEEHYIIEQRRLIQQIVWRQTMRLNYEAFVCQDILKTNKQQQQKNTLVSPSAIVIRDW